MLWHALTCQHLPPEVLSTGQPWTPKEGVRGLSSRVHTADSAGSYTGGAGL